MNIILKFAVDVKLCKHFNNIPSAKNVLVYKKKPCLVRLKSEILFDSSVLHKKNVYNI